MADHPTVQVDNPNDSNEELVLNISPTTPDIMNDLEDFRNTYGPNGSPVIQTEDLHNMITNAFLELSSFIRQPACNLTIDSNLVAKDTTDNSNVPSNDNQLLLSSHIDPLPDDASFSKKQNSPNIAAFWVQPLAGILNQRTDRPTTLKDIFGNKPVVIVYTVFSTNSPIQIKATMVVDYKDEYFESLYGFKGPINRDPARNSIRFPVSLKRCGNNLYIIELNIEAMKMNQSTLKEHENGYKLTHFPSGQERPVRCAKKPTTFVQKYRLDQPCLALQFFYGKSETPLEIRGSQVRDNVLYFNPIKKAETSKADENKYKLNIQRKQPLTADIQFHDNMSPVFIHNVEIPNEFWQLASPKSCSLCISITNHDQISHVFKIFNNADVDLAGKHFMITTLKSELQCKIRKKNLDELENDPGIRRAFERLNVEIHHLDPALCLLSMTEHIPSLIKAFGFDRFRILFQLVYLTKASDGFSVIAHPNMTSYSSTQFTEESDADIPIGIDVDLQFVSNDEPSSNHKRCQESEMFNIGLPVYKKLKSNSSDEQIRISVENCRTREKISLNLKSSTSVKEIKDQVHQQWRNIFPEEQCLVCKKKKLVDEQRLLDYKIQTGDTIYLRPKLRGG